MSWTSTAIVICCLLAAFMVWKELRRASRGRLALRIIASLATAAALGGILLPVAYSRQGAAPLAERAGVLLTAGFEPDSLGDYRSGQVFTSDKAVQRAYPKAKLIRLDELRTDSPALAKLQVFGYGLSGWELSQLGDLPLVFHPSALPGGIVAAGWNGKLIAGETLSVQGRYKNGTSKAARLILWGLGTALDQVIIPAKAEKEFELSTVPKTEGRALYRLLVVAGGDTTENESLPVQIAAIAPLKILMLSASADFETRFLKNWLSENGFKVSYRSAISKEKFSSGSLNMRPVELQHLNAATLGQFDLVIGDQSVLRSEPALKQQVIQHGLGLIVRADSLQKGASWLQADFPLEKLDQKDSFRGIPLRIAGKKETSAPLQTAGSSIGGQPGTQPLVDDALGHILVSSSLAGQGRLVFSAISNTYNWVLAGNKGDYSSFWSLLISKAARGAQAPENWAAEGFPAVNQPAGLLLQSASAAGRITADSAQLAPWQNPTLPFQWNITYWPNREGWQTVRQNNGEQAWWYVYPEKQWQAAKASEKLAATSWRAKNIAPEASVTKQIHEKVRIEVPKIYFYLLMLAACVYLWVEGKLFN